MVLDARRVLDEVARLAVAGTEDFRPFRWIGGGTDDDTLVVVFRCGSGKELLAKHWALREHATMFDPVDEQILAGIVFIELVEPGGRDGRPIPDRAAGLLPAHWRDDVTWVL